MNGPPKKRGGLCRTALRKLRLLASYHFAAFHAKLFEAPFWFFEQRRARIADRIDNQRSEQ
jgi:hypothetical protein